MLPAIFVAKEIQLKQYSVKYSYQIDIGRRVENVKNGIQWGIVWLGQASAHEQIDYSEKHSSWPTHVLDVGAVIGIIACSVRGIEMQQNIYTD